MGIQLKEVRIRGFRGLENVAIDFETTTVIVGTNNAGKTTILKALQLALTNSIRVTKEDFHISDTFEANEIMIDTLFIAVDEDGKQTEKFEEKWIDVLGPGLRGTDDHDNQILAFRTVIKETDMGLYKKKQYYIDEWKAFKNEDTFWYQQVYLDEDSYYFEDINFLLLDANRDILDDLKQKTSFLGRILSSVKYNDADTKKLEQLIKNLNESAINKSDVLLTLQNALKELDTAMDNPNNAVEITPFAKKIRDLNKGVKINYSDFPMEYHGMGTRSWSSLLTLKSFITQSHNERNLFYTIFGVEEPESHLHPNAQKKLYAQINDMVGQKIISTHSNYIAGSAALDQIRSVTKDHNKKVTVHKVLTHELSEEDIRKIERQVINTRGELFFSKLVVLCEGETEEQALPILFEKYSKEHLHMNSFEVGVDFVGVGGYNYMPFIRLFEDLNIQYLIFSDADVTEKVKKQIKKSLEEQAKKSQEEQAKKSQEEQTKEEQEEQTKELQEEQTKELQEKQTKELQENLEKQTKELQEKYMSKVIFLSGKNNFEKELIQSHRDEVIEVFFKIKSCDENAKKSIQLEVSNDDEALHRKIKKVKTEFAPKVAEELVKSHKELPKKVLELFDKIDSILKKGL